MIAAAFAASQCARNQGNESPVTIPPISRTLEPAKTSEKRESVQPKELSIKSVAKSYAQVILDGNFDEAINLLRPDFRDMYRTNESLKDGLRIGISVYAKCRSAKFIEEDIVVRDMAGGPNKKSVYIPLNMSCASPQGIVKSITVLMEISGDRPWPTGFAY